jgi:hypothetical protein
LRPDLRAFFKYEPFGDGPSLLGASPAVQANDPFTGTPVATDSAFRSLMGGHLTDFTAGVFLNVPLGFRFELAAIRTARLQLAQSFYFLKDQEDKAVRFLAQQYQEVDAQYKLIEMHRSERISYGKGVAEWDKQVKAGKEGKSYADLNFLQMQRSYAAALVKEYASIAEYNNALARLEFSKGTTLLYNNVYISEGPLPQCAQVRAVEYEKERSRSLVLCQSPESLKKEYLTHPGQLCAKKESEVLAPVELPPVTLSEGPDSMPPSVLPAPPVAEGKSKVQAAPIAPIAPLPLPVGPSLEKVEFKSSPTPAPSLLPVPSSNAKPIETPSTPLFLQQTSNLPGFDARVPEGRPVAGSPTWSVTLPLTTARGALDDATSPR